MVDWLDELKEKVEQETGKPVPKRSVAVAQTTTSQPNNLVLFVVIFVLVLGGFWVFKLKSGGLVSLAQPQQQQWGYPQSYPQIPWTNPQVQPQQQWTVPPSNDPQIEMLKRQYETLDAAARKIWERTKWNADRMTLLATINNHNLVVQQNNLPKTELILLNEDWTINRIPDRIKLDNADQEFMRQFLRK